MSSWRMLPAVILLTSAPATPAQQIEALIQAVARLEGASFLRNGTEHTPKEAADHLRLKWKNASGRVKTAADFIRLCASGSSLSGKPYVIRLQDGRKVLASEWFWTTLKELPPGA